MRGLVGSAGVLQGLTDPEGTDPFIGRSSESSLTSKQRLLASGVVKIARVRGLPDP